MKKVEYVGLLFIFVLFNITYAQNYFYNPENGHYYSYNKLLLVTQAQAVSFCSTLGFNNSAGYLVTITSQSEFKFLENNIFNVPLDINSKVFWISGTNADNSNLYSYGDGPEKGEVMYIVNLDQSRYYSLFHFAEPSNLDTNSFVTVAYNDYTSKFYMKTADSTLTVEYVICEYGGLELPFMPAGATKNGIVTVKGNSGFPLDWIYSNMQIKFTVPGQPISTGIQCTNYVLTQVNNIQCTLPLGSGVYDLYYIETASNRTINVKGWGYRPPWISIVYPPNSIGTVTIAGYNFGSDPTNLLVWIGDNQQACNNPTLLVNEMAITCILPAPVGRLLPVTISVNGIQYTSYKSYVYWNETDLFYSGTNAPVSFSLQGYSSLPGIYGFQSTKSITTSELKIWYSKMYPYLLEGSYLQWNNMFYDSTNFIFKSLDTSLPVTPSYGILSGQLVGSNRLYLDWAANVLSSVDPQLSTSKAGLLVEYGGYNPLLLSQSITIYTSGATVSFRMSYYGSPIYARSYVFTFLGSTISYDSSSLYNTDVIMPMISVTIPPGVGTPGNVVGTLNGVPIDGTISITYFAPNILSISPAPSDTGLITIIGNGFGNDPTYLSVSVDTTSQCSNIKFLDQHLVFTCEMGPGIPGSTRSIIVTLSSQNSLPTTATYWIPLVSSISKGLPSGGQITIKGLNFYIDISIVTVTLDRTTILTCTMPVAFTEIHCILSPGRGSHTIQIQVGTSQSSLETLSYNSAMPEVVSQQSTKIIVEGLNFGYISAPPHFVGLTIEIGPPYLNITNLCTGMNNTMFECILTGSELFSGNGQLKVTSGFGPNYAAVNLRPVISVLGGTLYDTTTTDIMTISGMFFDNSSEPIRVTNSGVPSNYIGNITVNSYNTIYYSVPQYTGKNHTIRVLIGQSMYSNSVQYSYLPPSIVSVTPTLLSNNTYSFTVIATQMGSLQSNLYLSLGGYIMPVISFTSTNNTVVGNVYTRVIKYNTYLSLFVNDQEATYPTTLKPVIGTIKNRPPLIGGLVTIIGYYLSYSESPQVILQSQNLQNISLTSNTTLLADKWEIIASFTPGTGLFGILLTLPNSESDIYQFSYQSPIVRESTELYFNQPGNVTITGDNFAQVNPTVSIGSIPCTNPFILSINQLVCHFSANVTSENGESLDVSVTVDSLTGSNQVFFYTLDKDCEKNCSGHGDCDRTTSTCTCYTGYIGSDCSIKNNTKPEPPKTDGNGNTNLPGQSVNFNISLAFIREKKFDDSIVKVLDLTTMNIIEKKLIPPNTSFFKGEPIQQPSNSIKYQISIFDWDFEEQTNHLELIYKSSTPSVSELNCEETKTNSTNNIENYRGYKIQAGSDLFETKFSDRMIVDNRLLKSRISQLPESDPLYQQIGNTEQDELSILISLSTPYFRHFCTLDPNFSVLLTTESNENNDCDSHSKSNKWKLPVILVVSITAGLSIAVASIWYFRNKIVFKRQRNFILERLRNGSRE
ncbi:EGF-like domain-containing protein [Tieghemostelium lacteum]|uniref:EGF-like domain-containing protein n=1 Tax=Tieghemostelium lacteum TaxID=361077 RepID=A0A152A811_TIELA|nr:EGF-like domain-containing protein [Tieghemostelium lacteum]|eukprot:KYR02380.1 EGF-like domain-containing protein [Tieghemostelium lacteum]